MSTATASNGDGDHDGTVIMMTMMKPIDERLVFKRARCFVPDGGTDIGAWGVLSRQQIWRWWWWYDHDHYKNNDDEDDDNGTRYKRLSFVQTPILRVSLLGVKRNYGWKNYWKSRKIGLYESCTFLYCCVQFSDGQCDPIFEQLSNNPAAVKISQRAANCQFCQEPV